MLRWLLRGRRDWIGLVEVRGVIRRSEKIVARLRSLRESPQVRAIVVHVDSPGGAVVPSQEIFEAVRKAGAAKRVVASMGSVAASGGYYIAAGADRIYACPGTITGSIGVIMRLSNAEELMGRIGLKSVTIRAGSHKDVGNPLRPMTPPEREYLQGLADAMYGQFVGAVARGRGMDERRVRALAEGRVYTGEQALAAGLVDRIGSLEDAIEETARLMGVRGEPAVLRHRERRGLLSRLVGTTGEALRGAIADAAQAENAYPFAYLAPNISVSDPSGAFAPALPR